MYKIKWLAINFPLSRNLGRRFGLITCFVEEDEVPFGLMGGGEPS
jgi:hypothetical protein